MHRADPGSEESIRGVLIGGRGVDSVFSGFRGAAAVSAVAWEMLLTWAKLRHRLPSPETACTLLANGR